jgi:hypothetical protein
VTCPGCGLEQDCKLVQSINTKQDPEARQRLLRGELNVLACACGKRTQLVANVLFHDPDADYYCQVVPGGDAAMAKAAELFRASGAQGTQRLVPTQNALVEKVKLLDAGLEDWAIEMTKILLLASTEAQDLDRVLLFERVDHHEDGHEDATGVIRWVMFAGDGAAQVVSSPLTAYEKLASRRHGKPTRDELQIDRAWAVEAVRQMIADAN